VDYFDIEAPVSREEALAVPCPLCSAPTGQPCVYTADNYTYDPPGGGYYPRTKQLVHRKGDPTAKHHNPRSAVVREQRYAQWKREQRDRRPVDPVTAEARKILAAMRAWDAAEYHALVTWWKQHGHIIVNAAAMRPDGSVRGRSYRAIDAERDIDGMFGTGLNP
jgi:hypothetical protein